MPFFAALYLCWIGGTVQAESAPEYAQPKISLLSVITDIPSTSLATLQYSFSKESIPAWAAIIGTTAITYHYDADLLQSAQADGRRWGIGNMDNTKTVIYGFNENLLRLPSDTGSSLYFLGDGWTHAGIALGFFSEGFFTGDTRPYNTGLEIAHGMIVSTIFSQAVKRAAGRNSPNTNLPGNDARGNWRPFPSVAAYQGQTASYDAFPSGHIMTATLTFTIINENYPEYFNYVFPLELAWLAALGFEMMNNGVHWASDYPLGIGLGYAVGRMAARMATPKSVASIASAASVEKPNWTFFPSLADSGPQMNAVYAF